MGSDHRNSYLQIYVIILSSSPWLLSSETAFVFAEGRLSYHLDKPQGGGSVWPRSLDGRRWDDDGDNGDDDDDDDDDDDNDDDDDDDVRNNLDKPQGGRSVWPRSLDERQM